MKVIVIIGLLFAVTSAALGGGSGTFPGYVPPQEVVR